MENKLNGYVCFYKGNRYEIYAESSFAAQCMCAANHNIKKRYDITVILAEKNGKAVTHTPDF